MNWDLILNFVAAMIAILNPIGKVPVWTELTSDKEQKVRGEVALLVSITGLIVLLLFLLGGKYLLNFFNIDLPAFQIAGGILLLLTSISMVQGKALKLDERNEQGSSVYEIARKRFRRVIVPLVFPIIAGPGSITTVIIYGLKANGFKGYISLSVIVIFIIGIVFLTFLSSKWFEKKFDYSIFTVVTRLFGLILAAIAVQFIVEGLGEIFPNLLDASSAIKNNLQESTGIN